MFVFDLSWVYSKSFQSTVQQHFWWFDFGYSNWISRILKQNDAFETYENKSYCSSYSEIIFGCRMLFDWSHPFVVIHHQDESKEQQKTGLCHEKQLVAIDNEFRLRIVFQNRVFNEQLNEYNISLTNQTFIGTESKFIIAQCKKNCNKNYNNKANYKTTENTSSIAKVIHEIYPT